MTINRLREVHQARPFRAFTMYFADGGTLRVTHPESLAYDPVGRTGVFFSPDDKTHFIDLLLVSRIEVGNGARRRRRRA